MKLRRSRITRLIIASLITWGVAISWYMSTVCGLEAVLQSLEPDEPKPALWSHRQLATWILKAVLWIVAGVLGLTCEFKPRDETFDGSTSRSHTGEG